MSLRKGASPKTIATTLTITGQGSTDKLDVTYHNRKKSELDARIESGASIASLIPFLVESWGSDFPLTEEGVLEFEDEYPGICSAIAQGFHQARHKELEKN